MVQRSSETVSYVEQTLAQKGPHVSATIRNQIYVCSLVSDAIHDAVRFDDDLSEFSDAGSQKFLRVRVALWYIAGAVNPRFYFFREDVRPFRCFCRRRT